MQKRYTAGERIVLAQPFGQVKLDRLDVVAGLLLQFLNALGRLHTQVALQRVQIGQFVGTERSGRPECLFGAKRPQPGDFHLQPLPDQPLLGE